MRRHKSTYRVFFRWAIRGVLLALFVSRGVVADLPRQTERIDDHDRHARAAEPPYVERVSFVAERALHVGTVQVRRIAGLLVAWYLRTPAADRVAWGGIMACAGLGLGVLCERLARLRRRHIIPAEFTAGFLDRLYEGKLDCGEALDHCERNPSPAASVALAAVRRWGRPAADLERAVAMAHRVESERLRRNVGTLRRIAVLSPLLGLLGTLFALGRALERLPATMPPGLNLTVSAPIATNAVGSSIAWGPLLAAALTPLSAGLVLATLALVAYDGLLTRIEKLAGALDRLGAETIDAIALSAPISSPMITLSSTPAQAKTPHRSSRRRDRKSQSSQNA